MEIKVSIGTASAKVVKIVYIKDTVKTCICTNNTPLEASQSSSISQKQKKSFQPFREWQNQWAIVYKEDNKVGMEHSHEFKVSTGTNHTEE